MVPEEAPRTLDDAHAEIARLRGENRTLKRRLDEIEQLFEAARRGGKRQSAPFYLAELQCWASTEFTLFVPAAST